MDHSFFAATIAFGRTVLGLIVRPYETMRQVVVRANKRELVWIACSLAIYFFLAAIIKSANFFVLAGTVILTFSVVSSLLWSAGKLLGATGDRRGFVLAWAYTLLPTGIWFLVTTLLYIVLPPPRTTSVWGVIFSFLFLIFSIMMLFWKCTLAYLAIRFGLKLDLKRILGVVAIASPIIGGYVFGMYRLGIMRVPFI